jgi:hypothetical protein
MKFRVTLLLVTGIVGSGLVLSAGERSRGKSRPSAAVKKTSADSYAQKIAPLVGKYCVGCHGDKVQTAGINFLAFRDEASVLKARTIWENVSQRLRAGAMPPKNVPQPTKEERTLLIGWIDTTLSSANCDLKDPGRVTIRRLNRAEYNNTIRDLLGVPFRPADDFPSDDVGYGFDNIGDVLTISPLLMEKYLAAAEKIAEKAIFAEDANAPVAHFEAERMPETGGDGVIGNEARVLHSVGQVTVDFNFPKEGDYLLRARAFGQQAGDEPAKMTFRLDAKDIETADVKAIEDAPQVYQVRVSAKAGKQRFAVAFINDYYQPRNPDPKNRDRNLVVDSLEIVGPLVAKPNPLPDSHRRVIPCDTPHGEDCARKILREFARKAWRRPVTDGEVERLARYVNMAEVEGDSFERGVQLAVQAALASPHFLFRVELDAAPGDAKAVRELNDFELASRLSYFLWSSMPDDELFALAEKERLRDPKVLAEQARRMMKDPKSRAFVQNFAGQWLQLRNLSIINPDRKQFPTFDEELRAAMRTETELFFEDVVRNDRSVLDFIDGKFTYLNERLAKHYGYKGVEGTEFRRVPLAGPQRGGVLTHASVLLVTSNPTRTSPVKRGKWILEQILGTPPPPPPPDVPELKEEKDGPLTGTLRQRMEQHRANPACATCHAQMDALGFGFENYDPIGAWRKRDGEFPIDASATLPDGEKFASPAQLKTVLRNQSKQFVKCLTEKMLTYALGRGLVAEDRCAVDEIGQAVKKNEHRFSALVTEIVTSEPFRKRRGDKK